MSLKRPYSDIIIKGSDINLNKELIYMINLIRDSVIKCNGIVFGGAIRDEIIRDYYANQYYTKGGNSDIENYTNKKYIPETKMRLLIPSDIDVYFNHIDLYENFLSLLNEHDIKIEIIDNKDHYKLTDMTIIKIMSSFYTGRTFENNGHLLEFKIDVLLQKNFTLINQHIEPPFYCLDFDCNCLIQDNSGIRISNCTGTFIDNWNYIKKFNAQSQIYNNIINLKTNCIFSYNINYHSIHDCFYRIVKIINKGFDIKTKSITTINFNEIDGIIKHNTPKYRKFGTEEGESDDVSATDSHSDNKKKTCIICFSDLSDNAIKLNHNYFDYDCFSKYCLNLKNENKNKYVDPYKIEISLSDIINDDIFNYY